MLDTSPLHIKNFDKFIEVKNEISPELNKPKAKNQFTGKTDETLKVKIDEFRDNGLSYEAIGKQLGLSRSAVSGIMYRKRHSKYK